jgi:hypothetical protein
METSAIKRNVKVRAIRPHDTTEGMKAPGDEYQRTVGDAKQLADYGVVELTSSAPFKRTAKRKLPVRSAA